jgi:hypothetical protein
MGKPTLLPSSLPPKTLTLRGLAEYLQLGSPQAAQRWITVHGLRSFKDKLGRVRCWVKDIDAACFLLSAEAYEASRQAAEDEDEARRRA